MQGVLVFLLGFGLLGCNAEEKNQQKQADGRINVVCTTGMIADMAQQVGGERVKVIGLMGPGVDPHYYKASQGDVAKLRKADVVFYNGLFLEGKMEGIFTKMARDKKVVAVAAELPPEILRKPAEFAGHFDPHIWFDVGLWRQTIDKVVSTLAEMDPEGASNYQANGDAYNAALGELDQWVRQAVETIPKAQRLLVTAHDAFGYFGRAYGVEVVALQGVSTVAEYGVKDVSQLVDLIVERQVKAIFVESSVPERSINAVRQGCQARGFTVEIGGTLYSDAMGGEGSGADTYIGMVKTNVNTVVSALK
jgi:manganese/zinc/iron transport system substrate-binding protein